MKTMCEFHGEQEGKLCPICPYSTVPPISSDKVWTLLSQISQAEERGREATITAFEEQIKVDYTFHEEGECYPDITDYCAVCITKQLYIAEQKRLLKFADSLKSNAPKV